MSKHYAIHHKRDPNIIFLGIDRFSAHWRSSSLVREISRMEMSWIHRIMSNVPYDLNVDVDVNAFIDNS